MSKLLNSDGFTWPSSISTAAKQEIQSQGHRKWRVLAHVCPEGRDNLQSTLLRDNHLLDATLLATVAASIAGVAIPGETALRNRPRGHVSFSDRTSTLIQSAPKKKSPAQMRAEKRG
ncbi:MAG: hypothetical protein SGI77_06510 [Pirellulaceae bacterium]|nr:hypothetical protein [Pirellulaceae bacterium]